MILSIFAVCLALVVSSDTSAPTTRTLLFADAFDRNESQEQTDEMGGQWKTNSKRRAGGNKQADLRDGALHFWTHEAVDHPVSITQPTIYKDCRIELKFRLDHADNDLGIDFADMAFKEVQAGHICKVFLRADEIEMEDLKNGRMKTTFRDSLKADTVTAEQRAVVKAHQKKSLTPFRCTSGMTC